jgi:hypothetical protein
MSQLMSSIVGCPQCGAAWSDELFSCVDADTNPFQVDAILDGSFERATCSGCGLVFRPEHELLFVSHSRRLWIAMQPASDRRRFVGIERDVARIILDNVARAAPLVGAGLVGIRPRLVFGQHMLTEAVRVAWAGLDPELLECAKLLTVKRNLPALIRHGPFELCFERFDGVAQVCGVHALPGGERVAELALTGDVLSETQASQPALHAMFPELFERPYVSATRYLIADTV